MEQKEALHYLAEGHAVWTPELADLVCDAFGVKRLKARSFHSDPPGTHKGLTMDEEHEGGLGVYSLTLSHHVADELGLEYPSKIGRGFQAQVIAQAIAKHMKEGK